LSDYSLQRVNDDDGDDDVLGYITGWMTFLKF